ncbi:hypothetical protein JCGZ_06464 [Jatropha curcas]|uniref:Uncharacterized protein n=1 Tax=Jatropha curcas TaxID=180498 RepID=A0A067KZX0_JATCU|nr:hypothetical protein JCGZ_06464 [Jatropha curcas]
MPTPADISALDLQAAVMLTQAYNDFAIVLRRIMVRPVSQIPPEGRRQVNATNDEGDTANKTIGDGMEEEDSSWRTDTHNKTQTHMQSTPLLRNICHNDEE